MHRRSALTRALYRRVSRKSVYRAAHVKGKAAQDIKYLLSAKGAVEDTLAMAEEVGLDRGIVRDIRASISDVDLAIKRLTVVIRRIQ